LHCWYYVNYRNKYDYNNNLNIITSNRISNLLKDTQKLQILFKEILKDYTASAKNNNNKYYDKKKKCYTCHTISVLIQPNSSSA